MFQVASTRGVFVEDFSDWELEEAWKKYSEFYKLDGQLTPALESVCRHPLMLQLLCVSFEGKSIPLGLHRKEIFDRYWKEKILTRGGRALESSVYTLVEKLYEMKMTQLNENQVSQIHRNFFLYRPS